MTDEDPVTGLRLLGLSETESQFLVTVGRHGGWCLARQYPAFAGLPMGGPSFLNQLTRTGRMKRVALPVGRGFLYVLTSPRMYNIIGAEVPHWWPLRLIRIAREILMLDMVLAHPAWSWVVGEAEQIALFTHRFGVPLDDLPEKTSVPRRRRPDVDPKYTTRQSSFYRWPVALVGEGASARVHFVVPVFGSSGRGFSQFVIGHSRLLARLPAWTVVAVTPVGRSGLEGCRAAFHTLLHPDGRRPPTAPMRHGSHFIDKEPIDPEVLRYFRTRQAVEAGAVAALSVEDLEHYREARTRFISPTLEARYEIWRVDKSISDRLAASTTRRAQSFAGILLDPSRAEFQGYQVPHSYRGFGLLAVEG